MRTFNLVRHKDIVGITGTGIVAEGIEFNDGGVVLRWLKGWPDKPWKCYGPTTVILDNISAVIKAYGYDNAATIEWLS